MVDAACASDAPRTHVAAAAIVQSVLERPHERGSSWAARSTGPRRRPDGARVRGLGRRETELRAGRLDRAVGGAAEGSRWRELGQSNIVAAFLVVLARVEALRGRRTPSASSPPSALLLERRAWFCRAAHVLEALLALGPGRLAGDRHAPCVDPARRADGGLRPGRDARAGSRGALVRLGRRRRGARGPRAGADVGCREVSHGAAFALRCEGLLAPDDAFAPLFARAIDRHVALGDPRGGTHPAVPPASGFGALGCASTRGASSAAPSRPSSGSTPPRGRARAPGAPCERWPPAAGRRRGTS
jgi:hypothetical protein